MTVKWSLRVLIYLIFGLVLILSCVIQSSHAAPKGLKEQLLKHSGGENIELKLVDNKTTHEKSNTPRIISGLRNIISPRAVQSALAVGADKVTALMVGVDNVLNANTNIEPIDRFARAFATLINSQGGVALNNYYNTFANFWVNFDAQAQFIRGLENRIIINRAKAATATEQVESNAVAEETALSLIAVNAQIEDLKNNLNNLLRRHDIARVIETSRSDVINDKDDEDEDEQEEEEDQREENVNSLPKTVNSPADEMNQKYSTTEYNDGINDINLSDI